MIQPFGTLAEGLLFFVLILIIGFLYIQLVRKNLFIQAILEKLNIPKSKHQKDEILTLLSKVQAFEFPKLLSRDHFFDKEILDYVFEDVASRVLFLHYTMEESVAQNILHEGFQFRYSFYKTAEKIRLDKLDLIYRHSRNKHYGKFILVISISEQIYHKYSDAVKLNRDSNLPVEQILTEVKSFMDENQDKVFTLSNKFVKGYINYSTGKIVNNPDFEPEYDSEIFRRNLTSLSI